MHVRLRNNCNALNSDLYSKNIIDSAACECGAIYTAHHFFFSCYKYRNQREDLFAELLFLPLITMQILLYGEGSRSLNENIRIFNTVQKFIEKSKLFKILMVRCITDLPLGKPWCHMYHVKYSSQMLF